MFAVAAGLSAGALDCGPRSPEPRCDAPQPFLQPGTDLDSGYQRCESGLLIRVEPVACGDADAWTGDCREVTLAEQKGPDFPCLDDVDCEDGDYCLGRVAAWGTCLCQAPSCQSDADCDGGVCWCEGARSRCIAAECRKDADCEGEARCAVVSVSNACGDSTPSLACTDANDECHTADDCDMFQQCDYVDREGRRQCVPTPGPCG